MTLIRSDNILINAPKVLKVERPYYEQEQLNDELKYSKPINHDFVRPRLGNPKRLFLNIFPVFNWLLQYNVKRDMIGDIISGCTVAVMHIPQGMGYALLANVPPIIGIYTAFFPVLVYFVFGTSRHISMGTFAVVSIMVGKSVTEFSHISDTKIVPNATFYRDDDADVQLTPTYTSTEVATTLCFVVAIIQLSMYLFRLGIISSLLSETLVSGFTTGAAIHVVTSQIKDLLGIQLPTINGPLKLIYTYIEIFREIGMGRVNYAAITISTIFIIVLVVNNEVLKPRIAKLCIVPVPIELICVVIGTLISRYAFLPDTYGITPIGNIPTGFPSFELPKFALMPSLLLDGFTVAMVGYTVSVSMALIFAQRLNYEINFNQELLAMGGGNLLGSFFSCIPFAASLSRSAIQQGVGGRTQVTSVISCSILAIVLLWVGPFFEPLPRCVLASIIVVALKGMLMQVTQCRDFYRLSRLDALVWLATFLAVIILAIDIGLAVGIVLSLMCIFVRGMKPYTCLLGNVPKTDFYLDIKRYKSAEELKNIKIFHYCGSLNFASRAAFKTMLCHKISVDLAHETKRMATCVGENRKFEPQPNVRCLIIDFSALSYIDPSGCVALKTLIKELNNVSITVYIASCSCPAYEMMKKCDLKEQGNGAFKFYPTVHDAVHNAIEVTAPISVITEDGF